LAVGNGPALAGGLPLPSDGTALPLTQSALTIGATAIGADPTANNAGATVTISHADSTTGALSLVMSIPGLGLNSITLTDNGPATSDAGAPENYSANIGGGRTLELQLSHLNYVAYGAWTIFTAPTTSGLTEASAFVTGYQSPNVSGSGYGSAYYSGVVSGVVAAPNGSTWSEGVLSGNVSLLANFYDGSLSGTLGSVTVTPVGGGAGVAWNTVELSGSIVRTSINGTTSVDAASSGAFGLGGGATGVFNGAFYGLNGAEAGAVWSVSDGTKSALGVFAAEYSQFFPGCPGTVAVSPDSPPCPPTPASGNIGTPVGVATTGGPTFAGLNATVVPSPTVLPADNSAFPLTQEVLHTTGGDVSINASATAQGATLTVSHVDPKTGIASLAITIPAFGINTFALRDVGVDNSQSVQTEVYSGIDAGVLSLQHLNYLVYGAWDGESLDSSVWFGGYQTPTSGVPTSGQATYSGNTIGRVSAPANGGIGMVAGSVTGNAQLTVNFATGNVNGALTNMVSSSAPWNDVAISATLSGASFSGSTSATSAPGGQMSQSLAAKGTIQGALFGPTGQELGAVWTLFDGTTHGATGVIGAKR
jgi:hypothetical protein